MNTDKVQTVTRLELQETCMYIHVHTCTMYIDVHTYIHTYIHTCIHTYIHTYTYIEIGRTVLAPSRLRV